MNINIFRKNNKELFNELKKNIDEYKYVSFDVYDTLIKRECCDSKSIFVYMDRYVNQYIGKGLDFYNKRLMAEKYCRQFQEEVTLEDIYSYLKQSYSNDICQKLKCLEISFEITLSKPNQEIISLYNSCVSKNKRILILSDMYLSEEIISYILKKNGFDNYFRLYVSSRYGITKRTGRLYDLVLDELNININEIIHIGDNFKSDYIRPLTKGIQSVYIKKHSLSNLFNDNRNLNGENIKEYNNLIYFINNNLCREDSNLAFQIGYEALGPLLKGFNNSLMKVLCENNINKVFFLARDGQILQKAFELLPSKGQYTHHYLYASRRALIVPILWMCNSLDEVIESMFFPRFGTIESFLIKIGLESTKYNNLINNYNFSLDKNYEYKKLFSDSRFKELYKNLEADVKVNSRKEYELYIKYLREVGFVGKLAVIDIGWHGNMQKALQRICLSAGIEVEIYGYYIGINPQSKNDQNIRGYIFDRYFNEEYYKMEKMFNSVLEAFLIADHGSIKKLDMSDGKIVPIFFPFEFNNATGAFEVIRDVQSGALKFVSDVSQFSYLQIKWSEKICFQNMLILGISPNYRIAKLLGDILFKDDYVSYLAKPKCILTYIMHPLNMLQDFKFAP